jgi:curved DNA-binding protein CbpA
MAATPEHAARILNLSLKASLEDVKLVRRKMALKHHPDCSRNQEQSTRRMARINAAADTLNAHIKKQTGSTPKMKRPNSTDFSARHKARRSSTRSEEPNQKPSPKKDGANRSNHEDRPHAQAQETHVAAKPERPIKASRADIALIRFASNSYASALKGIGRKEFGPKIDVYCES